MRREWYNIAKFMEKIESDRKENNNTIESKTSVFTNALDEELEKWKIFILTLAERARRHCVPTSLRD